MKRNGKGKSFIYKAEKPLSYGNDQNLNFYHLSQFAAAALIKITPGMCAVSLARSAACS